MPVSRGRGGRKRPDKTRQRARARAARPRPQHRVRGSYTDAELSTVEVIAKTMGGLPKEPACPGPLLVHANGAFECHGPGCPGGMAIFHDEDALDPCHTRREVQTLHTCPRCSADSDDAELAEVCTGQQIDHDDGTTECAAGDACVGSDALHMSSRSCRFSGPCPRDCQPTF